MGDARSDGCCCADLGWTWVKVSQLGQTEPTRANEECGASITESCYIVETAVLLQNAPWDSGSSTRKGVEVRILSWAPYIPKDLRCQMQSGSDMWQYTGGTGKFKGIKGSGTCKGTASADGSTNWTCTATYSLPK